MIFFPFLWAKTSNIKISFLLRYHTAKSNTGLVALTTPYMDAGGAGVVITAAHTIYNGKANEAHTTNDHVMGVMAADFTLPYFHRWASIISAVSLYFYVLSAVSLFFIQFSPTRNNGLRATF